MVLDLLSVLVISN